MGAFSGTEGEIPTYSAYSLKKKEKKKKKDWQDDSDPARYVSYITKDVGGCFRIG